MRFFLVGGITLLFSFGCFAEGSGDALLNTKIVDLQVRPRAKEAFAKVFGPNAKVSDLVASNSSVMSTLEHYDQATITRFMSAKKISFDLMPFEIEIYRRDGYVPRPSLASNILRLPAPAVHRLVLRQMGLATIEDLKNLPLEKLNSQSTHLRRAVKIALDLVLAPEVYGPPLSKTQLGLNRRRDTHYELKELGILPKRRSSKSKIKVGGNPEFTFTDDTHEALKKVGITDGDQLRGKSERWLEASFPLSDRDNQRNVFRIREVRNFMTFKFGAMYFDDLESAIDRQDWKASIDPVLMNLPSELMAELGEVQTVQDLIDRARIVKIETEKNPSQVFKSFWFRLNIYLDRCEAKLANSSAQTIPEWMQK